MGTTTTVPVESAAPAVRSRRKLDQCTPGLVDAIGDRLLTFDPASSTSLELLRFGQEFSESRTFEKALRVRIDQVAHLQHPAITPILAVERLEDNSLLLVSKHASGQRLTDLLPTRHGPVVALDCIRQLTPELATLSNAGNGVAHGVLTLDRIVSSHGSRLVLVEHVLGPALESLNLPPQRLRDEFGLPIPARAQSVPFDGRFDAIQLGFVALCLLLGRRLDPADYPVNIVSLLDESASIDGGDTWAGSRLRTWIERALQMGPRPLTSMREALSALNELPKDTEFGRTEPRQKMISPPPAVKLPAAPVTIAKPAEIITPAAAAPAVVDPPRAQVPATLPMPPPAAPKPAPVPEPVRAAAPPAPVVQPTTETKPPAPTPAAAPAGVRFKLRGRLIPVLGIVAAFQAAIIVGLVYFRSQPPVIEVQAPATPAASSAAAPAHTTAPAAIPALATTAASQPAPPETHGPTPLPVFTEAQTAERDAARGAERIGGLTFTSPIELQVFENGKLVGSTSGPMAIMEGTHTLDVVNEPLGFRAHETVIVKPGQLTSRAVPVPNGRISINAVPWADVLIDGNSAGQTPLANLSIPIGNHEIVFRHPDFSEQRQTAAVSVEGLTRVSVTMKK